MWNPFKKIINPTPQTISTTTNPIPKIEDFKEEDKGKVTQLVTQNNVTNVTSTSFIRDFIRNIVLERINRKYTGPDRDRTIEDRWFKQGQFIRSANQNFDYYMTFNAVKAEVKADFTLNEDEQRILRNGLDEHYDNLKRNFEAEKNLKIEHINREATQQEKMIENKILKLKTDKSDLEIEVDIIKKKQTEAQNQIKTIELANAGEDNFQAKKILNIIVLCILPIWILLFYSSAFFIMVFLPDLIQQGVVEPQQYGLMAFGSMFTFLWQQKLYLEIFACIIFPIILAGAIMPLLHLLFEKSKKWRWGAYMALDIIISCILVWAKWNEGKRDWVAITLEFFKVLMLGALPLFCLVVYIDKYGYLSNSNRLLEYYIRRNQEYAQELSDIMKKITDLKNEIELNEKGKDDIETKRIADINNCESECQKDIENLNPRKENDMRDIIARAIQILNRHYPTIIRLLIAYLQAGFNADDINRPDNIPDTRAKAFMEAYERWCNDNFGNSGEWIEPQLDR
ncbi:MAG: hypothetical protein QM528_06405 [Phycisphaerales bacterium]|nr:hypothetical protein [Phycisphaerales bacterium]